MSPLTIILALVVLGFLIAIHELGHMMVAKWCGMRVLRYSIGFGPVVWQRERGETTYQFAAVPFGGFVEIDGMNPYAEIENPEDERLYLNRPVWQRMLVIAAGAATNYLFAIVFAIVLFGTCGVPDYKLLVDSVKKNNPAMRAGIRPGDEVTHVDGRSVRASRDFTDSVVVRIKLGYRHEPDPKKRQALRLMRFQVRRGKETLVVTHPLRGKEGKAGLSLENLPKGGVRVTALRGPATPGKSGLQKGDVILAALSGDRSRPMKEGKDVGTHALLSGQGFRYVGQERTTLSVWLRRKGKRLKLSVEPDRKSGLIGVVFRHDIEFVDASLGERLGKAVGYPVVLSWRMLQGFGKLFKWDKKTVESAKGPVGIVQEMEKRFRGPIGEASLMVIILSVLLGLFNLLPIPALDGGRLVFQFVELISRRRLNPRTEAKVHYIGFMLLLALILLLTVRDIRGCFGW